jgi:transcriptional regulator with XRE-family HTH domain
LGIVRQLQEGGHMKKLKRRKQILILMIERDLGQKDLAELLGYSQQYINNIIRAKSNGSYKFWQTFKEKLNIPDTEIEKYKEVS